MSEKLPTTQTVRSPDGVYLARISEDGLAVWLLNGLTRTPLRSLATTSQRVYALAFAPDGARIALACLDGSVVVHATGFQQGVSAPELTYTDHRDSVIAVAFSTDGQCIASGSWDRSVRLWDVRGEVPDGQRTLAVYTGHSSAVYIVACAPDGQLVASAELHGPVHVWRPDAATCVGVQVWASSPDHYVEEVQWTQEGHLALHLDGGAIEVWDVRTGAFQGSPSRIPPLSTIPARM